MNINKKAPDTCPQCGSDDFEGTDFSYDCDCAWFKFSCHDCDCTWTEYYKMIYDGYATNGHEYDAEGNEVM